MEAFRFDEQVDGPLDEDAVEDADSEDGMIGEDVVDDVVVVRGVKTGVECVVGASTIFVFDERVGRCGFCGF